MSVTTTHPERGLMVVRIESECGIPCTLRFDYRPALRSFEKVSASMARLQEAIDKRKASE